MRDMDGPGYSHHVACTHSNHLGAVCLWSGSLPIHVIPLATLSACQGPDLMPGCDEDVILPRRCDVCVISTALATHIM